ncbi:hypothetical protein LSI01_13480 [Furfurilactobacillus siliginis]|uniref:Uncharacterized protein n=1 Tax=Furfurilactobacillus siliginis TaxID=348151 RepID=A0A510VQ23_9LACO|nr:hypothetical protein LSI01_13480 [Furfurilactobacillus siliginis]
MKQNVSTVASLLGKTLTINSKILAIKFEYLIAVTIVFYDSQHFLSKLTTFRNQKRSIQIELTALHSVLT